MIVPAAILVDHPAALDWLVCEYPLRRLADQVRRVRGVSRLFVAAPEGLAEEARRLVPDATVVPVLPQECLLCVDARYPLLGWQTLESALEALAGRRLRLFFGRPSRVWKPGCEGTYEAVVALPRCWVGPGPAVGTHPVGPAEALRLDCPKERLVIRGLLESGVAWSGEAGPFLLG